VSATLVEAALWIRGFGPLAKENCAAERLLTPLPPPNRYVAVLRSRVLGLRRQLLWCHNSGRSKRAAVLCHSSSGRRAVARQLRLRGSAALLTGRLFDDRGNRVSQTHANKRGVRYRYYRMRFCRIARPNRRASPACRPRRSRPSCAKGSAGTLQQRVERSCRPLLRIASWSNATSHAGHSGGLSE
jgi:hypothetical protein